MAKKATKKASKKASTRPARKKTSRPTNLTRTNDRIADMIDGLIADNDLVPQALRGTDRYLDIINWNIRYFNGRDLKRVERIARLMSQLNADIFVLQEIEHGSLDGVVQALRDAHAGSYKVHYGATGGDQRIAGWWRFSPVPRFAMAAGLLLLLGTTLWLLRERARMREELAARIAAERVERERHAAELDRLRSGQTPPPASPEPAPAPLRTQTVVAFLLSPTSVRGGAAQPLRLPAGVDQAQLRLRVAPDEGRRFEAGLQTADGESVWRGRNLAARSGFVAITIPAARLPHNDYVLILSSIDSDGRAEELRRYSFRVTRE